jgi:hypothetical protein
MAFLGSFGKFLGKAAKAVVKTVKSPAKFTTAIMTGGLSVVAPKIAAPLTNVVQSTLFNPALVTKALGLAVGGGLPSLVLPKVGVQNMGFDFSGILSGVAAGVGNLLGGGSASTALSSFTSFLPGLGGGLPAAGSTNPMVMNTMSKVPQIAGGVATVGRSFFNRYPNLAVAIQGYRNMGKKVTRAKLYSLVRRFGPELVISGGLLTAAAVNELMIAGPGHRRMNPGNVKALRRSLGRLESFHKLCLRVDRL